MQTKAIFEKVSFEQFMKDWVKVFPDDTESTKYVRKVYNRIKLPMRSTCKSAGYDFFIPENISFVEGVELLIPTGIRLTNMADDEVLLIYPRSGLGTKYRFVLTNHTAIIDADYADSDNEGHILIKMVNDGQDEFALYNGKAFCQGIITKFCVTADDSANEVRNGGFGSSDKPKSKFTWTFGR